MAPRNKPNELRLIRVFDAPVAVVWEAWTDPEKVSQWWGPRGFTLTTHHRDFRVGGRWEYTMHGPDGVDYPNVTPYLEIEKHRKLVYDHGASAGKPPLFRVTALFSELEGGKKTQLDMTMTLPTEEAARETQKFIKKAGGDATWDRLAEFLDKGTSGNEVFVINRSFDVPVETMFEMWTKAEHVAQWVPPTGFTMQYLRADIRPGGSAFYSMSGHGITMYGRAEYLQFEKPQRIVYTQQFCDADEKLARHPMAPTWPATTLTVVTLTPEGPDRTRVTVHWTPQGRLTAEELATFVKGRPGMTVGWTGSFDKLEQYLSKPRG